ncbi:MAG: hypothetical protein V1808_00445 [Candidatus Daviesbacteria bacterium]
MLKIVKEFKAKFWLLYPKIVIAVIFILGLFIIVFNFYSLIKGFYFTGDTISYFDPAYPGRKGDLLSVMIWCFAVWPPTIPFIFNILRFLPISFISQHHIYIFGVTLSAFIISYLIVRNIVSEKKWQIPILAIMLFTGFHGLLFMTAMSEPLFILAWLATIYSLERFLTTQKERFLLIYIITGSLIPMSRYSGMPVLLCFELILIVFVFLTWKSRKYSPALVLTSLILVWVPLSIYLMKNYLVTQTFFGTFDRVLNPLMKNFNYALMSFLPKIFMELWALGIASLIIGMQIKWNKILRNIIILAGFSSSAYCLGFALSLTKNRYTEYFPSRYTSVTHPEVLLALICLGSLSALLLKSQISRLFKILMLSLIFVVIVLSSEIFTSLDRFIREGRSPQSVLYGAENSIDVRNFCLGKAENKYIFLQESSRNWVAQAFRYYCQPLVPVPLNVSQFNLPKGSILLTPYRMFDPKMKLSAVYKGDKEIKLYDAEDDVVLDIAGELKRRDPLDNFGGSN